MSVTMPTAGEGTRTETPIGTPPDRRSRLPARWPIVAPLVVLGAALLLRLIDVFVLRLDERIGEIILSKALGFVLVVAYVWWVRRQLSSIGMHRHQLGAALLIGAGVTAAAFALGGIVQAWTMPPGSAFAVQPVDPKTGAAGGVAFALLLIVGNVVNSSMEEGLFRGLMLPHFLQRMSFRRANLLQASLFALWHMVWPVKSYLTGQASAGGALAEAGTLLLATGIAGLVYGYLYRRTDSLWSPWIAHFMNNTILNLIHVRTTTGDLQPAMLLAVVAVTALLFAPWVVRPVAERMRLSTLRGWTTR